MYDLMQFAIGPFSNSSTAVHRQLMLLSPQPDTWMPGIISFSVHVCLVHSMRAKKGLSKTVIDRDKSSTTGKRVISRSCQTQSTVNDEYIHKQGGNEV